MIGKDTSLTNKTKKMGNIIKQIKPGGKVDLETSYVWFKNNCPINGPLYDDFRKLKNHLEIINHKEAIEYIEELVGKTFRI